MCKSSKDNTNLVYPRESYLIRGGCFDVYKKLRNKHKETVYQKSLKVALEKRGLTVDTEVRIPVYFEEKKVGVYIPDMIINNIILIELKSKKDISKQDLQQFWHYLKSTDYRVGFLVNFGKADGVQIMRRIHGYESSV